MKKFFGYSLALILAIITIGAIYWPKGTTPRRVKEPKSEQNQVVVIPITPVVPPKSQALSAQEAPAGRREQIAHRAQIKAGSAGLSASSLSALHFEPSNNGILPRGGHKLSGELSTLPFPEELLESKAKVLPRTPLTYPEKARRERIEGYVTLTYHIKSDGTVSNLAITASSPAGYFEENSLKYVASWRFSPAIYKGQPVEVLGKSTIEYRLP